MTTSATTPVRRFGATDAHLAPLALGAMHMGTLTDEATSRRILDHFVGEVAPRFAAPYGTPTRAMIDTADCYCWWNDEGSDGGHSERVLSRWMSDSGLRESVYLATKGTARVTHQEEIFGDSGRPDWDIARRYFVGASAPVLRESLAGSLDRLGIDSVDLYYVHVDDPSTPLEETLAALADFVADGRIGGYGWSNVRTERLARIRAICDANGWPGPAALQQQHSYLRPRPGLENNSIVDEEQMAYLRAHADLPLVAYSPILKGAFSDASKRAGFWALEPYRGADTDARFDAVDAVAKVTGATSSQVVLAWLMAQNDPKVLPLVGPRTWEQYSELIEALDLTLTDEQLSLLNEAGA